MSASATLKEESSASGNESPVRVMVVDDQHLFRSGLAGLLRRDPRVAVVGEAADGAQAVKLAAELVPEVILMDLKMPNLDGVQATEAILASHPEIKVLILSTFDASTQVLLALRAGARGYVGKDATPDSIVHAILAALGGHRILAESVAIRVLEMIGSAPWLKESSDGLTPREVEILKLVASGLANKQVAYRLRISEKTVRNHISNFYEKLSIADRSQAVLYAVRKGLIEP